MSDGNYDTLFVSRQVRNSEEIVEWARDQGLDSTVEKWDLHVTIAFSRAPLVNSPLRPIDEDLMIEGGERQLLSLGPEGQSKVLAFESLRLQRRWGEIIEAGATWDFPSYTPHITLTNQPVGIDLSKVKPYTGRIILGSEWFDEITPTFLKNNSHLPWLYSLDQYCLGGDEVKVIKVDEKLGIVFGWAIISKINGEEYFDHHSHHIPEETMLKAAAGFMEKSRLSGDMHREPDGQVVFAWPLTTEIAKSMNIETQQTGLMVGMKPEKAETLEKFANGTYTGFSIGLRMKRENMEEVE